MVDDPTNSSLHRSAIAAALRCEWNQALNINKKIIKNDPENVDCLNRLGKAYLELGKLALSKKAFETSLKLDPYNTIAQKNLKKVASFKKNGRFVENGSSGTQLVSLSPDLFLEEPGTTRLVSLIKVAEPQKLMTLSPGQSVELVAKSKGVYVTDKNNQYLGVLPDDTGFHLRKLMSGGNKYLTIIKSIRGNGLMILIREVFRSKKFKNQASFLENSKILTYSSENISALNKDQEEVADEQTESDDSPS